MVPFGPSFTFKLLTAGQDRTRQLLLLHDTIAVSHVHLYEILADKASCIMTRRTKKGKTVVSRNLTYLLLVPFCREVDCVLGPSLREMGEPSDPFWRLFTGWKDMLKDVMSSYCVLSYMQLSS